MEYIIIELNDNICKHIPFVYDAAQGGNAKLMRSYIRWARPTVFSGEEADYFLEINNKCNMDLKKVTIDEYKFLAAEKKLRNL